MYTDMEQWNEIRHRVLVEGQSKRSVCKEFDLHWDTLGWITAGEGPPYGLAISVMTRAGLQPMSYLINAALARGVLTNMRLKYLAAANALGSDLTADDFFKLNESATVFGQKVGDRIRQLLFRKHEQRMPR